MRDPLELPGLPHSVRLEKCANCKFAQSAAGETDMECRRSPPVPTSFMLQDPGGNVKFAMRTAFPRVNPASWCGEFAEPKTERAN